MTRKIIKGFNELADEMIRLVNCSCLDKKNVLEFYMTMSKFGIPAAFHRVGFYLQTGVLDGISVNGKDIGRKEMFTDTSVPFFKKAYALGYSEAAYDLAFYYFKKSYGYKFYCHKPVPLNIQRRLKYWATKAMRHEHGIRRGQMCHFIGWYYYQFGNKNTAVAYWRRGARAGCIESCIELGICYGWGEGVSRNIKRSLYWFARSIILDRKVIGRVKREMRRMGIVYGDGFRRLCSAWER